MHTFTLLAALLSLTTSTLAYPPKDTPIDTTIPGRKPPFQEVPSAPAAPRPTGGSVFICEHVNWGGKCEHKYVQLGSGPGEMCNPTDGLVSSIGPDEGFTCYFYTNDKCNSEMADGLDFVEFTYPGSPNLANTPKGNYNDKFLSFQCILADE